MIKLNYKELIIISLITIIISIISEYSLKISEKNDNILTKLKKKKFRYIFIISLVGIVIHLILSYLRFDEWYCEKTCINDECKLLCHFPINK